MKTEEEKQRERAAKEEARRKKQQARLDSHTVTCPHCGKSVLDHMTKCPHCEGELTPRGYKPLDPKKMKIIKAVTYSVGIAVAIAVFVLVFVLQG